MNLVQFNDINNKWTYFFVNFSGNWDLIFENDILIRYLICWLTKSQTQFSKAVGLHETIKNVLSHYIWNKRITRSLLRAHLHVYIMLTRNAWVFICSTVIRYTLILRTILWDTVIWYEYNYWTDENALSIAFTHCVHMEI